MVSSGPRLGSMTRVTFVLLIVLGSAITGATLTAAVLRFARKQGWFDVPNHRSSHTTPTPRGGGASIVAITLAAELIAWRMGYFGMPRFGALFVGGALVAGVGALDDVRGLSIRWRLLAQFVAGTIAVAALSTVAAISFDGMSISLAGVGGVITVVGIVWMTNLYNFMDGIDGIAGLQGVVASASATALFVLTGQAGLASVAAALLGALIGFLVFNWEPARIFMGDVASGFLGFTFAVLAISGDHGNGVSAVWILIPLSPFIADTSVALVSRIAHGARIGSAHREHLYQRLVQNGHSHRVVAASFGLWAAAMATLSIVGYDYPSQTWPIFAAAIASTAAAYRFASSRTRSSPSASDGTQR